MVFNWSEIALLIYTYDMNTTEIHAQKYFERSGFRLVKIPETNTKTPDFEGDDILVEVKQIVPEEVESLSNEKM